MSLKICVKMCVTAIKETKCFVS